MGTLKTTLLSFTIVVLVLLGAWYLSGAPASSLLPLDRNNISQFATQFDNAASTARVLLLVSPT